MAITVSPIYTETDAGEVIADFSVDRHHELHQGKAPDYLNYDEATGDYTLDLEPTDYNPDDAWSYDAEGFTDHPILGNGSARDAALYWMQHGAIPDDELSAMLDGLEAYDGIERQNLECLIAFKQGDLKFNELPIELQQSLVYAVEGDTEGSDNAEYVRFDGTDVPLSDYNTALIEQAQSLGNSNVEGILRLNQAVIDGQVDQHAAWDLMVNTFGEDQANALFDEAESFYQQFLDL